MTVNFEYDYNKVNNCNDNFYANTFGTVTNPSIQNKQYLTKVYSKNLHADKVDLSVNNQKDAEKKLKEQKKRKGLIIAAVGLTVAGAVITAFATRGKFDTKKVLEQANNTTKEKLGFELKNAPDIVSSWAINFTNIKDDLWKRFTQKVENVPILKHLKTAGEKYTNFASGITKNTLNNSYDSILEEIEKTKGGKEYLAQNPLKTFDDLYNDVHGAISKSVEEHSPSVGLFEGDSSNKIKNFIKNFSTPIAQKNYENEVAKVLDIKDIPQGASEELKNLIQKYNNLQEEQMVGKLRDFVCGSAPTDIITSGIPAAAFGVAMLKTDDKEERKSLMLDLGIPLIPTLLMPFLGYRFPILNGIKAMAAGFAVGKLVSIPVKMISAKMSKNKDLEIAQKDNKNNQNSKNLELKA